MISNSLSLFPNQNNDLEDGAYKGDILKVQQALKTGANVNSKFMVTILNK